MQNKSPEKKNFKQKLKEKKVLLLPTVALALTPAIIYLINNPEFAKNAGKVFLLFIIALIAYANAQRGNW